MRKQQPRDSRKRPEDRSPTSYPTTHVDQREGSEWPRFPRSKPNWTGWLTHREYNVIERTMRYDYDSMYSIGASMGMKPASAERMMHSMRESGIITPDSFTEDYRLTERALELWSMTDEYMLSLDLGDLEL